MKPRLRVILSIVLPVLTTGVSPMALAQGAAPASNANPIGNAAAIVDGRVISASELEAAIRTRLISLKSQEYTLKRQWLDDTIDQLLLQKEAARRGISVEQLTQKEIEGKIRPATADQLKAIYESTKDQY